MYISVSSVCPHYTMHFFVLDLIDDQFLLYSTISAGNLCQCRDSHMDYISLQNEAHCMLMIDK